MYYYSLQAATREAREASDKYGNAWDVLDIGLGRYDVQPTKQRRERDKVVDTCGDAVH